MAQTTALPYERVVSRKKITDEQWREYRKSGIGGSDAGAVAGYSGYATPFTVYFDKKGLAGEKHETEGMRQGTDLEDYVAKRFCEETGKEVKRMTYMLRSKQHPFMLADVDRLIVNENAILECKTSLNYDKYDFDGGEFPAYWLCQCLHYMAVLGADRAYLAVLVLGKSFHYFTFERTDYEDEIAALIEIERRFWKENVEKGIPPAPDGSENTTKTINRLYPDSDDEKEVMDLKAQAAFLSELNEVNEQIKELTTRKDELTNQLKLVLGDAPCGMYEGYKVSWSSSTRTTIDTKKLKAELPDVFEQYAQTTQSRTFRFSYKKPKE